MNNSPRDSVNTWLWFGVAPMFRGSRRYRMRESRAAYLRQISWVPSVEALSEMTSSKSS